MNPNVPHPPPPAPSDPELVTFLTASTPRNHIPPKLLRETYAQLAPFRLLYMSASSVASGIFLCILMMVMFPPFAILREEALSKKYATASGKVISIDRADSFLSSYGKTCYETVFEFAPVNAEGAHMAVVKGVCYSNEASWKKGEHVAVDYDPDNVAVARIQNARLAKTAAGKSALLYFLFAVALGVFMTGSGILVGRKYIKQRAHSRWLLENGAVDEFSVVDFDIVRREEKGPLVYVYQLKLTNKDDHERTYFSQFTDKKQVDYANAVRRSKTTTFGLYDPTGRDAKRHVLMVEAWFHDA